MAGSSADMREAELFKNTPKPHFREIDPEALPQNAPQIYTPPARYPIRLRIGPCLYKPAQLFLLLLRQPRRPPSRLYIDEAVRTVRIETMDPVPQRLSIHGPDAGRLFAIHPLVNRRNSP